MKKLYVAYGSNLNLEQMAHRCPSAEVYGKGTLEGYKLVFNGVASIEKSKGDEVPVGVWVIDPLCERMLDIYEGYPRLYRKEKVNVKMYDGNLVTCMVYIMNSNVRACPSSHYFNVIKQGYEDVGLDKTYLYDALREAEREEEKMYGEEN